MLDSGGILGVWSKAIVQPVSKIVSFIPNFLKSDNSRFFCVCTYFGHSITVELTVQIVYVGAGQATAQTPGADCSVVVSYCTVVAVISSLVANYSTVCRLRLGELTVQLW